MRKEVQQMSVEDEVNKKKSEINTTVKINNVVFGVGRAAVLTALAFSASALLNNEYRSELLNYSRVLFAGAISCFILYTLNEGVRHSQLNELGRLEVLLNRGKKSNN